MDKRIMVAAAMAGVGCAILMSSIKPENVTTATNNDAASVVPEKNKKDSVVTQNADSKKPESSQPLQASPRIYRGNVKEEVANKTESLGRFGGTKFF